MPRKSGKETRVCEGCGKPFQFQTCYGKRGWKAGRFCSIACRSTKPNISELSKQVGFKARAAYRQRDHYQEIRLKALQAISTEIPVCGACGCAESSILEVNHIKGGGTARKESGVKLWRIVLKLGKDAPNFFNVRCKVCNQVEYVQRKYGLRGHWISWSPLARPRPRLLMDVDEVLSDFQTPMFEALYELYGRRVSAEDCEVWDCFSLMTPNEKKGVFSVIEHPGWCAALKPKEGAQAAIQKLREFVDVYAVTSHFPTSRTWVHERDVWLQEHFHFERHHIVHTSSKFIISGDAFLDDNPGHVKAWQATHPNGLAMLWHIPNTRKLGHDDVRVKSWDDVILRVLRHVAALERA